MLASLRGSYELHPPLVIDTIGSQYSLPEVCLLLISTYKTKPSEDSRNKVGRVYRPLFYDLQRLDALGPEDRDRIVEAFKELVDAVDARVAIEEEMKRVKSRSRGEIGILEKEVGDRLEQATAEERNAQRRLDGVIYDLLGLSEVERDQVERGLEELQEARRLRAKT